MNQFDLYGLRAASEQLTTTEASGRYRIQADGLKRAIRDIQDKLTLLPADRFLDIGCGVGDLTIPLSFQTGSTACVDHAQVLQRLQRRFPEEPIRYLAGNFLEIDFDETFDKILAYGVLICLDSKDQLFRFIDKALTLLAPGGKFLAGDFVNSSKKKRFLNSDSGKEFSLEWNTLIGSSTKSNALAETESSPSVFEQLDDTILADILLTYRKKGFETFLLPQPRDLAFGNTREDILFIKHR
jgi:ubiquinone/menaquinone biosynthesis C-methylase UbiE